MRIDLDHPSAKAADRSDKKKQPWEVVIQAWRIQAETKGRYKDSFSAFLEYAARCYIPVGHASVESKWKSRILLMVAVPITYRQLMASIGVSQPTASKIISDMKSIGCRYESQLLLMPAVNQDLFEILDNELRSEIKANRKDVRKVFGAGKEPEGPEGGDLEPVVLSKLNRGSKDSDRASEDCDTESGGGDQDGEEKIEGDRIARCREVGEVGVRVFF